MGERTPLVPFISRFAPIEFPIQTSHRLLWKS